MSDRIDELVDAVDKMDAIALLRRIADTLELIEKHLSPTWTLEMSSPPTCTHTWRVVGNSTGGAYYKCDKCGSQKQVPLFDVSEWS